jgi:hypothetical protein
LAEIKKVKTIGRLTAKLTAILSGMGKQTSPDADFRDLSLGGRGWMLPDDKNTVLKLSAVGASRVLICVKGGLAGQPPSRGRPSVQQRRWQTMALGGIQRHSANKKRVL